MNNFLPATLLCDFYKISHREQYPEKTEKVYATWTPRTSRKAGIDEVISFGFQYFIKEYLIDYFNENFFKRKKEDIINEYKRVIKYCLNNDNPNTLHIEHLHDLGYLPLKISAIEEGLFVPIKVPMLTIENTIPEFYWLVNYIETLMSCSLWLPITSATLSYQYRQILEKYAKETTGDIKDVDFQAHDFSMRGMGGLESSCLSSAGHLLNFKGTDTIPSILFLEKYYNGNIEKEVIGSSIPATEHSVMCAYGQQRESETYRHLLEDVYPNGVISIVSDTWNLWNVLTNIIKELKDVIMKRDGKLVIRPDSGDPVKILCGNKNAESEYERKGVIQILWEIFGGTITSQGYKLLDSHIGAIYGDAITPERCKDICNNLKEKGFASTNVVFGIGSFTYQFNTRDTFGFALKTTYAKINGNEKMLCKNPITDTDCIKKSQQGLVYVYYNNDLKRLHYIDGITEKMSSKIKDNFIKPLFEDGKLLREISLNEIRERIKKRI